MIDDIWKAAQDIHTNVGGINETQQKMPENSFNWNKYHKWILYLGLSHLDS